MTSIFGGAQSVPTTQATNQNITQASNQQQQLDTANAQAQQQQILPSAQTQATGSQLQSWLGDVANRGVVPTQAIAPLTDQQNTAISALFNQGTGMEGLVGQGQGYVGQGAGFMGQAGTPLTSADINSFYNPMAANVTAQMQNIFGQQNLADRLGGTATTGGVGGDRAAVMSGILANQQGLAAGQTYAGLYQQALQAAEQQKSQQLAAGQGLAGTGFSAMQAGIGGLGTALQAATIPQQQQQQILAAQYQQAMGTYQDPFLRAQALAGGIAPMNQAFGATTVNTGLQGGQTLGSLGTTLSGTQAGTGQGQTTYPAPSPISQIAGLGSLAAGAAGLAGVFSDKRGKTDIQRVGRDPHTGLPLHAFRYKGDPKTYPKVVGPMAQDVEKRYPQAVTRIPRHAAGGPVLPTSADWQSKIQPMLSTAGQFSPLGPRLSPGGAGTPAAAPTSTDPQVSSFLSTLLQNGVISPGILSSLGALSGIPGASASKTSFGFQEGGAVDTEGSSDSDPSGDASIVNTDEGSSTTLTPQSKLASLNKYSKIANLFQKAGAQQKFPQAPGIQFPGTPWRLGSVPSTNLIPSTSGMQYGGAAGDADEGSSQTPKKGAPDAGAAVINYQALANLAEARKGVPSIQKGDVGPEPLGARGGRFDGGGAVPEITDTGGGGDDYESEDNTGEGAADETAGALTGAQGRGRHLPGPAAGMGGVGGWAQSPYMALIQGGLGMLAASGQRDAHGLPMSGLAAIGQGGMAGMNTLQQQQAMGLKQKQLEDAQSFKQLQLQSLNAHRKMLENAAAQHAKRPIKMTDPDGNDYLADPETGRPIGDQAPKPANSDVIEENAAPATLNAAGNYVVGGKELIPGQTAPQGTNPQALVGHENYAKTVMAIDEGRMNPASLPRGKQKMAIIKLLNDYDPSWDQTTWNLRNKTNADWAPNGKSGQSMMSFNYALRHTADLGELTKGLNPSQLRILNSTQNWIKTQFSDPAIEKVRNQALVVSTEVPKMLRGAGVLNEQEEARWNERLLGAPKIDTFLAGLGQIGHAMNVRNDEMAQNYKQIMKKEPPYRLSAGAEDALNQLEQWRGGKGGAEPLTAKPAKPAPKEGDIIDGWRFKGGDPSKRENWEQIS